MLIQRVPDVQQRRSVRDLLIAKSWSRVRRIACAWNTESATPAINHENHIRSCVSDSIGFPPIHPHVVARLDPRRQPSIASPNRSRQRFGVFHIRERLPLGTHIGILPARRTSTRQDTPTLDEKHQRSRDLLGLIKSVGSNECLADRALQTQPVTCHHAVRPGPGRL